MAQYRVDETGKRVLVHATQPAGSELATEQAKPANKRAAVASTAPTTPATPGEAPKE